MTKLIETPYGRKTPELLCKAMDAYTQWPDLLERCLRALDEDDFPQLRQDLRDALEVVECA